MKQIWAPWRKYYLLVKKPTRGCLFCRVRRAPTRKDAKNLLLYRSRHGFVMLNLYPYNNGHLLIVPYRHVGGPAGLREKERLELFRLLDLSLAVLKRAFRPTGFNIGMNLGLTAGAGVPGHLHVHVVPRWRGDTNFMPVIDGTKVLSDSLQSTYRMLRRLLKL